MKPAHPNTAKRPKPPTLDAARAAQAVAEVPALMREAIAHLAVGDFDRWVAAGCRLLAMALADIHRGYVRRSNDYIETQVTFLRNYVPVIPARLAALRGDWAFGRRGGKSEAGVEP